MKCNWATRSLGELSFGEVLLRRVENRRVVTFELLLGDPSYIRGFVVGDVQMSPAVCGSW